MENNLYLDGRQPKQKCNLTNSTGNLTNTTTKNDMEQFKKINLKKCDVH
jgi:hypothetical protein